MKKNIKKIVLIALIFSAFLLWIPNAKAAGEHEFSFRAYKCGEIDFEADPETEEIYFPWLPYRTRKTVF